MSTAGAAGPAVVDCYTARLFAFSAGIGLTVERLVAGPTGNPAWCPVEAWNVHFDTPREWRQGLRRAGITMSDLADAMLSQAVRASGKHARVRWLPCSTCDASELGCGHLRTAAWSVRRPRGPGEVT